MTIALGVYNESKFLPGALDGLLSQTFTDFDLVISDNASTDDSLQIIKKYAEKDPRIRFVQQSENIGLVRNFNLLAKQGLGEYFMWAACDDRWSPDYVKTIIDGLDKDTSIILGFSPYQFIHENGERDGNIRIFDYSGKNAFIRLFRFFFSYDDGMTYGIYRYSAIRDIEFPEWWGINRKSALNSAYAYLAFVLAKGGFQLFGTEPLWLNCIKNTSKHYQPFRQKNNKLGFILFFIVRKANLAVVQFKNIWRGSDNLLLAVVFIPILIFRIIADIFLLIINSLSKKRGADSL